MGFRDKLKRVLGEAKNDEDVKQDDFDDIVQRKPIKFKPKLTSDNILFVCQNNNFVSPIAEAIFNKKVSTKKAYSAGVSGIVTSGTSLPGKTLDISSDNGIDLSTYAVCRMEDYELNEGVLILTSTVYYRDLLMERYPNFDIFTINEYAGFPNLDIEEPYGIDLSVWEERFGEVEKAVNEIVEIYFGGENIVDKSVTNQNERNFKYLDFMIHSGVNEIILDSDIVLGDDEVEDYVDGIKLDVDNIIIDGNGHKIEAMGRVKIFSISGCNVTLKNLSFLNGFDSKYFLGGGAIRNYSKNNCCLNCKFIYNSSSGSGGAVYNDKEASLDMSGCQFLNNSTINQGGAIFNGEGAILNIRQSDFSHNYVEKGSGGAIFNASILTIDNSAFKNNRALKEDYGYDSGGGAIFNQSGKLTVFNSQFEKNYSTQDGGAIFNYLNADIFIDNAAFFLNNALKDGKTIFNKGKFRVENSHFHKNSSISNISGNFKIFKSFFTDNTSDCIVLNNDQLSIDNSIFKQNNADSIVENYGNLSIFSTEFNKNSLSKSVIVNKGSHCSLDKTEFGNNSPINILNENHLILKNIKLPNDCISILNIGEIILKQSTNIEDAIDNQGVVKRDGIAKQGFDFTCLDNIIHSSKNREIILNHDFAFEDYEKEFFEGGIDLDIDDLTIDGKNHVIDAKNSSRIFIILAKNITLKNIKFKNGHAFKNYDNLLNNDGGVIRNNFGSNLKIINCEFLENNSEMNGGVISNNGKLLMQDCEFIKNKSDYYGGSIYNLGKLEIIKGEFVKNRGNKGGVIYNLNEIKITDSIFSNNSAGNYGGAIFNHEDASLKITNTCFKHNTIVAKHVLISGGAIQNEGELLIEDSSFYFNELYEGTGPDIKTNGKTIENNCVFKNNLVLDKDED